MNITKYLYFKYNLDSYALIKISKIMSELHVTMDEAIKLVKTATGNSNQPFVEVRFDIFCFIIEQELTSHN